MMFVPKRAPLPGSDRCARLGAGGGVCHPTADTMHRRPAEALTLTLSPAARAALARTEVDVQAGSDVLALWTTALEALKKAREAAVNGDSGTVPREASKVLRHAMPGLQQKGPSTELKRPAE